MFSYAQRGWFVGGNLGMRGMEGQSVPQRNVEGSIICRSSVQLLPSLRCNTITGQRRGYP